MDNMSAAFYFIPHTHWEGAVFKTRAEYLDMGLPNILRALRLLKRYPAYRFVLDQSAYVQPFLERYPEERAAFQQFVDEGRLAIAGGMLVMPDVNMPGGESFVRQIMLGKRYFRQALNVDVTSGWQLDVFGHHAQVPQLMRLAGYQSFWFFRGVSSWDVPAEFLWEGLDGTRIPAFWLAHSYAVTFGSPKTLPEFNVFFKERYELLSRVARNADRVGLAGADVCEPEEQVPALIDAFNAEADAPFTLRISTPADYEARAETMDRPVIGGELNPIFQGAYSSRIEVKQQTREIERLLITAEKQGAVLQWLGHPADDAMLWQAWDRMLFNQTHDLMSGVMTDHVFDDTMHSFAFAREVATDEVERRLSQIAARVDTQGAGIPVLVFNTLSWSRTDVAQVQVGFSAPDVRGAEVVDADGAPVPTQITEPIYNEDGTLLQATLVFIARDVPPMGYAVYHVRAAQEQPAAPADGNAIVNEHYRLELDLATGAITRMTLRADGSEALKAPANVVAMEPDHGDLWEPYHPLDGGSRIAMTDVHGVPQGEGVVFSHQQAGEPGVIQRGAVFSELTVTHPFSVQGQFSTTIRAYADLPRVDVRTRILNNDSFVRYRALFPSAIKDGQLTREIPFGAYAQPTGIEFPAQHWVDYSDGVHGLALLNRGMPGNNVADGTLLLSLLRCSAIVAYGFGGGYEPGMTSDSGQEIGKTLTLDYALIAHAGDWREAGIPREGWAYNHPLIARTADAHTGDLPARWGMLAISHPNVLLTSLKPGAEGSTIVRVYEAEGRAAEGVRIRFGAEVQSAVEVNLMEDEGQSLDVSDDELVINLRPFEIRTLKLQLR